MLRITESETESGRRLLRLEGRLVDEWVGLLYRLSGVGNPASLRLDLAGLSGANAAGVRLLRQLCRDGAVFEGCPPYLRDLCCHQG